MTSHAPTVRRSRRPLRWLGVALRFLNPLHTLFGPVYQKELATISRRRGTYLLRGFYVLVVLGIVSLAYLAAINMASFESGAQMLQRRSRIAPTLTFTIGWIQFVVLTLAAPLLTSNCICDEKVRRTLPSLASTPLQADQIIFGKLASRISQLLLLALLAAPMLLFLRVYGGIEAHTILMMTALTLASATLAGSVGLMYSVWHRRPWTVVIIATLTMIALYGGPALVVGLLAIYWPGYSFWLASHGFFLCPPAVMGVVHAEAVGNYQLGFNLELSVGLCVLTCIAAAVLISLFSSFALRRVMLTEAGGRVTRARRLKRKSGTTPPPVPRTRMRQSRQVGERPVLWRELHQPLFGRGWVRIVVYIILALVTLLIYARVGMIGGWSEPWFHIMVAIIGTLLYTMIGAVATTHVIASERDARSLEVLLTTPLSALQIVGSKYVGGLMRAAAIPALLLLHVVAFTLLGYIHPIAIMHILLIMIGPMLLLTGVGMYFSVACRTAMRASVLNLLTAALLWIGVPFFGFLLLQLVSPMGFDPDDSWLAFGMLAVNPFVMTPIALEGAVIDGLSSLSYDVPGNDSAAVFTGWAVTGALVQVVIGGMAFFGAAARLAMASGRRG
ncbi:MAG: ABC transporter permease subunit [Phycisphaerales bacterium]|nr:ABC transporter permease subunit [Phycisphaerales bacterium]